MIKNFLTCVTLFLFSSFIVPAKTDVKNYFNIAEGQSFDNLNYKLSWSSHPAENYYKQEYLPAGESSEHFNHMLLMDFVITPAPASKLVQLKKDELDKLKQTNPIVHYELFENGGEFMLDFILSDGSGDQVNIVEHNIYRYRDYTDKDGHKGVLLIGISERAYGKDITAFFKTIKETRIDKVNKLGQYKIPEIAIKP